MTDKKDEKFEAILAAALVATIILMIIIGLPAVNTKINQTVIGHAESGEVYQVGKRYFKIIEVEPEFQPKEKADENNAPGSS